MLIWSAGIYVIIKENSGAFKYCDLQIEHVDLVEQFSHLSLHIAFNV